MDRRDFLTVALAMAEHEKDADGLLETMLVALRSDRPDTAAMRMIADMLDPQSKRGAFRLDLKRRKGNRNQQDDGWYDRVMRVGDILEEAGGDETECVKRAAMPSDEGGVGRTEPVVRELLAAYKAHAQAKQEAWEAIVDERRARKK